MILKSTFFTQNILNAFKKEIDIKTKPFVLINLDGITSNVLDLPGTLAETSTVIGTRKKRIVSDIYEFNTKKTRHYKTRRNIPPKKPRHTNTAYKPSYLMIDDDIDLDFNAQKKAKFGKRSIKQSADGKRSIKRSASKMIAGDNSPTPEKLSLSDLMPYSRTPTPKKLSISDLTTSDKPPTPPPHKTEIRKQTIKHNFQTFIDELAYQVCKHKIGVKYGQNAVKNSIHLSGDFDIVILANPDIYHKKTIDQRMQSVYGIVVVQKGECKAFPDAYAIHLICTNQPGVSKYLLGLYLYTIIKHTSKKVLQLGVLELAGGYGNVEGFCAYSKFGFEYKPVLKNGCFYDPNFYNLPMAIELSSHTTSDIINAIFLPTPESSKPYLCRAGKYQPLIGKLMYMRYIITNTYGLKSVKDYYDHYNISRRRLESLLNMQEIPDEPARKILAMDPKQAFDMLEYQTFPKDKILNYVDYYIAELKKL
jgi:hypothetical protein